RCGSASCPSSRAPRRLSSSNARRRTGPSSRNVPSKFLGCVRPVTSSLAAAPLHDHRIGALVLARLVPLRRHAPWRDRMAVAARATAVRVIDRVHRLAAHRRADSAPPRGTGLADLAQAVLLVADLADRRTALDVHPADLARAQPHRCVRALAREQPRRGAGRASDLRALARHQLDAVDRRTDRDVADRKRVARADRRFRTVHQLRADLDAARREDVAALAIGVAQQRQVCGAVRVVLEALDLRRNAVLVATEVDDAVVRLVPAAAMTRGDAAEVVAARAALLALGEPIDRTALVKVRVDDLHHRAPARRGGLGLDDSHHAASAKLISWPSFRPTYALRTLRRRPCRRPKRLL